MKVAYGFPYHDAPARPDFLVGENLADLAVLVEQSGFAAAWLTDHPAPAQAWRETGGHDALDPFVGLAVVAAATSTLRLLTYLTIVPYRNPFLLAKAVATLDVLSGGRVELGMGAGYMKTEFRALGVDFDVRNTLFEQSLDAMKPRVDGRAGDVRGSRSLGPSSHVVSATGAAAPPSSVVRRKQPTHAAPRGGAPRRMDAPAESALHGAASSFTGPRVTGRPGHLVGPPPWLRRGHRSHRPDRRHVLAPACARTSGDATPRQNGEQGPGAGGQLGRRQRGGNDDRAGAHVREALSRTRSTTSGRTLTHRLGPPKFEGYSAWAVGTVGDRGTVKSMYQIPATVAGGVR